MKRPIRILVTAAAIGGLGIGSAHADPTSKSIPTSCSPDNSITGVIVPGNSGAVFTPSDPHYVTLSLTLTNTTFDGSPVPPPPPKTYGTKTGRTVTQTCTGSFSSTNNKGTFAANFTAVIVQTG